MTIRLTFQEDQLILEELIHSTTVELGHLKDAELQPVQKILSIQSGLKRPFEIALRKFQLISFI
jgi:hypothetical protein